MIQIDRDGTKLRVHLEGADELRLHNFILTYDVGAEWAAKLLVAQFNRQVSAALVEIRKESYAAGWKDAKAKKGAKETWFSGWWR